ncbi:MAG: DNA gyrase inhibitor YacG [Bauldia sp.]|nr:DNA gyrase inhibitor YacG [Bauldia sp.]
MARAPKSARPAEVVPLRPPRKCPICGKPAVRAYYPFDSRRCADIDLDKWLRGSYAIPAVEAEGDREDEKDDGEDRAPDRAPDRAS